MTTTIDSGEFLARVRAHYPGATRIRVDRTRCVWVDCQLVQGRSRDLPRGTVRLGTSPATSRIEADILAAVEAADRIAAGESPDMLVHFIGDDPARGLSSGLTPEEYRRGGYTSRYYRLGDLAGV